MNPDSTGETRIPLSLDINTSSLSQAQQAAERFEGTIEDLRTELERLRAQAVATFSAFQQSIGQTSRAPISTQGAQVSPYEHMLSTVQRNPSMAQAVPDLGPVLHQIARMERMESAGSVTGPRPPKPPMAGPPPGTDAATAAHTEKGAAPRPGPSPRAREAAQPRSAPQRPRPFSERLSQNIAQTRPLAVMGAFAHGDYLAGGRTIARAFLETMATDVRYARALRGALGTAATSAVSSGAAASAGSVAEGAMSAGAAGAAGAGEASMIGRVGALVTGPVALIGAAIAAVAGGALVLDKVRKQVAGQEYLLRGSVGGIGSKGDVAGFQGRLDAVGYRYMYKAADTLKTADTLGAAGVTAGQMPGAVGNSMAFSRTSGQDLGRVTGLTSQLMVQGGMSSTQVGAAYAQLQAAADQSGQSVAKLVTSLEDLLRTTGGGAQQINGLAAVQSILGTDPRLAAQVVGQPMGSTGGQAINTAGLLGISTERLQHIQETGNTAQMYDLLAGFAKRTAGGRKDQTTIDYVESAMQGAGLLNLAGIDPKRATGIVRTMLTQGPRAAQDQAEKIQRATALQTEVGRERSIQMAGEHAAGAISTAGDHIGIALDQSAQLVGLANNNINAAANRLSQKRTVGDGGAYVGQKGTPTAANGTPLPGATANVYSTLPLMGYPTPSGTYNLPKGGTRIANSRGGFDTMDPTMFRQVVAAATRYKVPVPLLMAELAKESDLNPKAERHNGPGDTSYGVAQFTPQTLDTLRKQRGSPIFGMTQAQALAAAKNQGQAIPLAAYFNRQLYEQNGNDWQGGSSAYNGSAAYGASVMDSASQIMQTLGSVPASGPPTLGRPATPADTAAVGAAALTRDVRAAAAALARASAHRGHPAAPLSVAARAAVAAPHPAHHPAGAAQSAAHTTTTAGGTQQVNVHLTGTLDVRDSKGTHLGTATIKPQTASIDHGRAPVGQRRVTPAPVIPHAPLHDHNRRA